MSLLLVLNNIIVNRDMSVCKKCWIKNVSGDNRICSSVYNRAISEDTIDFKKGECFIKPKDSISKLYCIRNGTVKIHNKRPNKKEFIVWLAGKGDILGLDSYLNDQIFSFYATAVNNVSVCVINVAEMNEFLRNDPFFVNSLANKLCSKIDLMEKRIGNLFNKSKKDQLIDFILLTNIYENKSISLYELNYSVSDITNLMGISRSYLNKLLHDLQQIGTLNVNNGKIIIRNLSKLIAIRNK